MVGVMERALLGILCCCVVAQNEATSLGRVDGFTNIKASLGYYPKIQPDLKTCAEGCFFNTSCDFVVYNTSNSYCHFYNNTTPRMFNSILTPGVYAYAKTPDDDCKKKPELHITTRYIGRAVREFPLLHRFPKDRLTNLASYAGFRWENSSLTFCYAIQPVPECELQPFGSKDGGLSLTFHKLSTDEKYGFCAPTRGACKAFHPIRLWTRYSAVQPLEIIDRMYVNTREETFGQHKFVRDAEPFCYFWNGAECPMNDTAEEILQIY